MKEFAVICPRIRLAVACAVAFNREVEETLHERHGERILSVARMITRSVELAERLVLYCDVRRIADDGMVLLTEDAVQRFDVLDLVVVLQFVAEDFLGVEGLFSRGAFELAEAPPVQECIAGGDVDFEVGRILEPADAAGAQRGEQEAEPGDGDDVWIQVHAEDLIQRALREHARVFTGAMLLPEPEQPVESTEQKMAGAAGRINHPHDFASRRSRWPG